MWKFIMAWFVFLSCDRENMVKWVLKAIVCFLDVLLLDSQAYLVPMAVPDWTLAHWIVCVHEAESSAKRRLLLVFLWSQGLINVYLCRICQWLIIITVSLENILLFRVSIIRDQTTNIHLYSRLPDKRRMYPLLGRTSRAWCLVAFALVVCAWGLLTLRVVFLFFWMIFLAGKYFDFLLFW